MRTGAADDPLPGSDDPPPPGRELNPGPGPNRRGLMARAGGRAGVRSRTSPCLSDLTSSCACRPSVSKHCRASSM